MKSQDLLTTENYVKTWPYIVLYQYQGITVQIWQDLRSKLGDNTGCMVVKNSSMNRVLNNKIFCGGSMCIIGVLSIEDFKRLDNITKDYNHRLFMIGGYWNEQCWTHNDVKYVCNLKSINHIVNDLVSTLSQCNRLILTVSQPNNVFIPTLESNNVKINNLLTLYSNKYEAKLLCIHTIRVNPTAGSPTVTLLRLHSSCDMRSGTLFL